MALRIIAGTLKGREVWTAKGAKFRPSTQFLRQRFFSIIGFDRLNEAIFLDVFAGSGVVGFEALSRGAKKAIFLEINYKNCEMIKQNAERFGMINKAFVLKMDATRTLERISQVLNPDETIDIVFIDPPFNKPIEVPFLERVLEYSYFFSEDCAFYLETRFAPKAIPMGFIVTDQRKTSSSILTALRFCEV